MTRAAGAKTARWWKSRSRFPRSWMPKARSSGLRRSPATSPIAARPRPRCSRARCACVWRPRPPASASGSGTCRPTPSNGTPAVPDLWHRADRRRDGALRTWRAAVEPRGPAGQRGCAAGNDPAMRQQHAGFPHPAPQRWADPVHSCGGDGAHRRARPRGMGDRLEPRCHGPYADAGGADHRRPAQGRVPGDAGPRAAQSAGPDPQRPRVLRLSADRRRRSSRPAP